MEAAGPSLYGGALSGGDEFVPAGSENNYPILMSFERVNTAFQIALCGVLLVGESEAQTTPRDAVLLIHGVCSDSEIFSRDSNDCTVAVSRQQFENLLGVLSPGRQLDAGAKGRIAKTYGELLAFDHAARKLGIDNSPQYQEAMRWLQSKTLADLLRHRLEQESGKVPEAEVQAYYREQATQFEEVRLYRIVLPKSNFAIDDQHKFEHEAQRIAGKIRERAASGEELEQLQKEAYQALGFSGVAPATLVGNRRRASLPSEVSDEVFSLPPGGISKIESESHSFVIYKVEAKWRLSMEQVRDEITREIVKRKLERALQSITGNIRTELNEEYFGTAPVQ